MKIRNVEETQFLRIGVTSKLEHLSDINVDAFWLSPIYPSPMVDFGYDISDFVSIDKTYGTMEDFQKLLKAAHNASIKVIMDFVPNHSSNKHEWFQKSLQRVEPYTDYYVWHKGKVLANGTVTKPNNWVSKSEIE
jgi:alpha-glucosidase